jgi:hypothetical protein
MPPERQLVCTLTGEPYQPARVYYHITHSKTVIGIFKKLRCMAFDRAGQRWVWLYECEAQKLRFETSYNLIPKQRRPVIIGYFIFRGEHQMTLDLRSFDRVCKALEFFKKRLNHRIAKASHIKVVNRLFTSEELGSKGFHSSLDQFFDREDIPCPSRDVMAGLDQLTQRYPDKVQRSEQVHIFMEELVNRTLPEVEELPIHDDEDEIESLGLSLRMRQIEALERWKGNKDYNALTFLQNKLRESNFEGILEKE